MFATTLPPYTKDQEILALCEDIRIILKFTPTEQKSFLLRYSFLPILKNKENGDIIINDALDKIAELKGALNEIFTDCKNNVDQSALDKAEDTIGKLIAAVSNNIQAYYTLIKDENGEGGTGTAPNPVFELLFQIWKMFLNWTDAINCVSQPIRSPVPVIPDPVSPRQSHLSSTCGIL